MLSARVRVIRQTILIFAIYVIIARGRPRGWGRGDTGAASPLTRTLRQNPPAEGKTSMEPRIHRGSTHQTRRRTGPRTAKDSWSPSIGCPQSTPTAITNSSTQPKTWPSQDHEDRAPPLHCHRPHRPPTEPPQATGHPSQGKLKDEAPSGSVTLSATIARSGRPKIQSFLRSNLGGKTNTSSTTPSARIRRPQAPPSLAPTETGARLYAGRVTAPTLQSASQTNTPARALAA